MTEAALESLFQHLEVRLNTIAVGDAPRACETRPDSAGDAFIFVLRGSAFLQSETVRVPVSGGSVIVVPAGRSYLVDTTTNIVPILGGRDAAGSARAVSASPADQPEGRVVMVCGSMSATLGHGLGLFDHLREPLIEQLRDETSALIFKAICFEAASSNMGASAIISSMLKQILVLLLRKHMRREGPGSPLLMPLFNPQLRAPMRAIATQFGNPHTLDSLAALAGMSRSCFAHHFMKVHGVGPMSFLQSVRLKAAARLLRSSNMPIKVLTDEVGFVSRSHFSRAFRGMYGVDPTAYREQLLSAALGGRRQRGQVTTVAA